jgi:potassium-dependent mechanosensitive channel
MRRSSAPLAALIVAFLVLASPAGAQTEPQAPDATPAIASAVDKAGADLHAIAAGTHQGRLDDAEIKAKMAAIPPIQARLAGAIATLTPLLQDADARLAQLGPAPSPGQPPEAPETANARRGVVHFRQSVHAEIIEARLLSVESDQMGADLAERLRGNFAARLWKQSRSILDPGLWAEVSTALPQDLGRLRRAWDDEREKVVALARSPAALAWLALAALLGLLLVGPGRMLLGRLGYRRAETLGPPTRLSRTLLALWLVLVASVTPLAVGALILSALSAAGALTPIADELAGLVIKVVFFATLLEGLGRAVLSPRRPTWRIAPIPDGLVARLAPYPGLIALSAGLQMLVAGVNSILGASLPTSVASDCLTLLVGLAAVGAFLALMARARDAHAAEGAVEGEGAETGHRAESRLPWILAALAAWLALGAAVIAVLLGYLALATTLMRETIWIATVLTMLFLLLRLADDLIPALLSPRGPLGRPVRRAIGMSEGALEHIGVLLSGLARLAVLLLGWIAILAPFGASVGEIASRITSANSVFHLGQASISPGAIFQAVALFLLAMLITRGIRRWLVVHYLPKTRLDVGVRTSVAAGVTYLGALIAVVLTFAYLGLSFSQIALFASALSVGIGFGLQAIIGNFVSGLILLAERPVKLGDWIAIGDLEGDVKRINIRATEIEMFDRSRLIVPNSDLISKTVRNITHSVALGRVKIVLKISDRADPNLVRDLILARFAAHKGVLREPNPGVFLTDVRDGAMEFTALAYVPSPRQAFGVKSELLFEIVPELKAKGIALANSTPVVNIGLPDRLIEPDASS